MEQNYQEQNKDGTTNVRKEILERKKKSLRRFMLISLHIASAFFIICETLFCYMLITNPGLIHTYHGGLMLFSSAAALFSILVGVRIYQSLSDR